MRQNQLLRFCLPPQRQGFFVFSVPCGVFSAFARGCFFFAIRCRVFTAFARTACFFLFSVSVLGREEPLFFRGVVLLPPQPPLSSPALELAAAFCTRLVFPCGFPVRRSACCTRTWFLCAAVLFCFFGSLRGVFCVCTRVFFLCNSLQSFYCVCTHGLFLFILCKCFGEGGDPLLQRRCPPLLSSPALELAAVRQAVSTQPQI